MRDDGSRQRVRRGRLSYPAKTKTSGYYPLFLSLSFCLAGYGARTCFVGTAIGSLDDTPSTLPPIRILC